MKNKAKTLYFPEIPQRDKILLSSGNTKIFVSQAGDIHLQTAKAELIIAASGEIKMSAINIQQQAQQELRLTAERNIHLN